MAKLPYLKFMGYLGAMLGQFPIKNLRSHMFEFSASSCWGIWWILVGILNVFVGQTVVISALLIDPLNSGALATKFSNFDRAVNQFCGVAYMLELYFTYISFFYTLPKFFMVCNKLINYDHKFRVKGTINHRNVTGVISYTLLWCAESLLGVLSVKNAQHFLKTNPKALNEVASWSWLYKYFGSHYSEIGPYIIVAGCIHFFLCHFGSGFAIQYVINLGYSLSQRLYLIEISIAEWTQAQNYDSLVWTTKFNKSKSNMFGKIVDIDKILAQITDLTDTFLSLREAASVIILISIGTTTLTVTILVYSSFIYMKFWGTDIFISVFATVSSSLLIGILKLTWLTMCGEFLCQRVSQISDILHRYSA